jgi:hypothetical protein
VQETPHQGPAVDNALDLTAGLIAIGLLALSYLGESGLPRILLTLGFAFFVPGRAIVTNWPRMTSWSKLAMPMILSLALLTLLATIALWAHVWKPIPLFQAEACLSVVGLCLGLVRRLRYRPDDDAWQQESGSRRSAS